MLTERTTLKLESFSVENYRSITQARQIPLSDSTVLIGPNNEGKSNILRALSAAMYALSVYSRGRKSVPPTSVGVRTSSQFGNLYSWQHDIPVSLKKSRKSKSTKINLEFSLNDSEIDEFKKEIKSNLNGTIPVCITFEEERFDLKIVKQGSGGAALNSKGDKVAKFLADRIQFQYIPAVRTASQATRIVESIISAELSALEMQQEYKDAISAIRELQKPILQKFSERTTETLKAFLPGMRSVTFSVSDERRSYALRQSVDIEVDDGAVTSLEAKGDGVQSLVALGLRRHILEESRQKKTYIFAVEEPEAHLHADAIHELRDVLHDIAKVDQIILTTHSGLLANRSPISSNVIVHRSKASPAKSLSEIRNALGIKSYDNLINAELVLLVEGDDDKLALRAILSQRSKKIEDGFLTGRIIIDSLDGAGSLGAKIGLYKSILCRVHCFLDYDDAGRTSLEKAKRASLIEENDYNLAYLSGRGDSEFEDLLNEEVYKNQVMERFGVDISQTKPRNKKAKWSARMQDIFSQTGKPFDDIIKQRLKFVTAEAVAASPENAIATHAEEIIRSLFQTLERKLDEQ